MCKVLRIVSYNKYCPGYFRGIHQIVSYFGGYFIKGFFTIYLSLTIYCDVNRDRVRMGLSHFIEKISRNTIVTFSDF